MRILGIGTLCLGGVLLLSGCRSALFPYAREMEDMALLRTMAVDQVEGTSSLSVTVSTGSRGAGGAGPHQAPLVLQAQRGSLSGACLAIQQLSDAYVFYGYVDQLLLGEELAKENMIPVLDYFSTDVELGLGAQVWLIRGGLGEEAVRSGGSQGVDNRLSTLQTDSEIGMADMTRRAGEIFSDLLENGGTYLPALVVVPKEEDGSSSILPGGYGILQDGRLVGYLEGECAKGLELLVGQVGTDILEIPLKKGQVVMRVTEAVPRYRPQYADGVLQKVEVNVQVTTELAEYHHTMTAEELDQVREALQRRQERRIRGALNRLQSWGVDCIGMGAKMGVTHPGIWVEQREGWRENFGHIPLEVTVDLALNQVQGTLEG